MAYPRNTDDPLDSSDEALAAALPAGDAREEVWLPVFGYPGYRVSNLGRVRGKRAEFLQYVDAGRGYPIVSFSVEGKTVNEAVHRVVLIAFCGLEPFEGAQAAHNNGVRWDCRLTNLRWASPQQNSDDVERHGTRCKGEDVYGSVLKEHEVEEILYLCVKGLRNADIAVRYGVSVSTIHLIRHRRTWKHIL